MNNLYQKTTTGIKWSALTIVIPKLISPLITITLARLLAPESFGLLSTAMIVISFSQMIWEAGLSRALIQTTEPIEKVANIVFWSNIVLGAMIYVIIFISAPLLADYFKSPDSVMVLRVLSVQIIIMALTTVQEALFSKDLNFRPLFWIRIATSVLSGVISIVFALLGFNVWALVFGTLFGALLNLFLLWIKSTWRPAIKVEWHLAPKLFRYGGWVLLLSLMGWLINWVDSILVGRYFGLSDLGIYRTGVTLIAMLFSVIMLPIATVMFPAFSRLGNDIDKVSKYFNEVNKIIISIVLPIGIGLFLIREQLVPVVFGDKWAGLSVVIGILGLSEGLSNICGINPVIYQAMGKPDLQPKLSLFLIPIFIIVYWLVAPFGMEKLLWAKLGLTLFTTPMNMIIIVRVLKLSPFYIFHQAKYIVISTFGLTLSIVTFQWVLNYNHIINNLTVLTGSIVVGAISYFTLLWIFDRAFLVKIYSLIKTGI